MKRPLPAALFLIVLGLLASACGPETLPAPSLPPTATGAPAPTRTVAPTHTFTPIGRGTIHRAPSASPTFTPIPSSTLTATPTLAPSLSPTPSVIVPASGTYRDWPRYLHTVYRFVFAVPPGWTASPLGANFIQISAPFPAQVRVTIGVRWADEDVQIQRTGVPEGELVPAGMVPFWGDEISKSILVYEGKDKAVLYNNGTEFRVGGNRVFTLGLGASGLDYAAVDLTNFIETADAMVGSIAAPE